MTSDPSNSDDRWIPSAEYDLIQARVPILCVDLLILDRGRKKVGLIRRETYDGGEGWCMIGGAVKRNECLLAAVERHVISTLGEEIAFDLLSPEPFTIAEYLTDADPAGLHDPRKHAVALTYAASCAGSPRPQGEALEFRWFDRGELSEVPFGFGQGIVVARLLEQVA